MTDQEILDAFLASRRTLLGLKHGTPERWAQAQIHAGLAIELVKRDLLDVAREMVEADDDRGNPENQSNPR